jgi:hypothetical protein
MTGTTNALSLDVRLHCPACHAEGFQFQPGAEPVAQLQASIECSACGWKGTLGQLDIVPVPPHPSEIN